MLPPELCAVRRCQWPPPMELIPDSRPRAPPLLLSLTLKGIFKPEVTVNVETDSEAPTNFNCGRGSALDHQGIAGWNMLDS